MYGKNILFVTVLSILCLILILLIIYEIKIKKFENFNNIENNIENNLKKKKKDTILNAINCININNYISNEFNSFINKFKKILKNFNLSKIFVLENSVKFSNNSINFNRYSIFIEFIYLKNKDLFNEILNLISIDINLKNKIRNEIESVINLEGQLIYGIDFLNKTQRVYLNYKNNNKYIIKGLQWSKNNKLFIKEYNHIENNTLILKKLTKMFDIEITNKFLEIFPTLSWDDACFKNDNSLKESEINSIQFSFKFNPKVKSLELKLKNFINLFYNGGKNEIIDKWLKCFSETVITYIQIGKRNNKNELTIYTASFNNNFLDEINNQFFNILNSDLFNNKLDKFID